LHRGVVLALKCGWPGIEGRGLLHRGVVLALKCGWPGIEGRGSDTPGPTVQLFDRYGRRVWPGIALYYAVLAFNLVVTGWIEEWVLLGVGTAVHAVTAAILWNLALRPANRLGLEKPRA
jgi:hypothetical protein